MKTSIPTRSGFRINQSTEGESIIEMTEKMLNNKETVKTSKPIIYTDRAEGVLNAFNIRADRFDIAIEAMDKVQKSYKARRDGVIELNPKEDNNEIAEQSQ